MQINPINTNFVADIAEVDLANLTDAEFERLYTAWLKYGVLRIRNQPLDAQGLQTFSARFGPLEEAPFGRMSEAQKKKIKNRYVTQLSNIIIDGKPVGGLGNLEASWHSDMTYVQTPPPASILLGIEIPPQGGDTHFADQNAAYQMLPDELRETIQSLTIKHDAAHNSVGGLRHGYQTFTDPREAPGAIHSIIRIHNETKQPALYLGRREFAYVPGLSLADSEALLDELWSYAAQPQHCWMQTWQPNDVIIWDNRRVLHRRDEFNNAHRRLMQRCQVLDRASV
ncbi:MAG: TauD/TfdA family dioxygenase [Pseudomonadota bacterium]